LFERVAVIFLLRSLFNMSNLPENISPYDFARIQLMGQLSSVADSMRKCADIAEHFSSVVAHLGPNGGLPPMPHFHNGPMADITKMGPPPPATVTAPSNGKRKAQVLADGEVKKKKVKKPRDPDAPKRPPSSYLLFQNEIRQAMKKANPGMANHEILTTISQRWASMTPEEKDTYHKRQEVAKAQYTLEKTAYDARHLPIVEDDVPPEAAAATTSSPTTASAPPAPAAIKPAKAPAPVVADTSTSSDDSSEGETSDSDSSDEVEEHPAQKKAKKATTSKVQPTPKKETKKKIKN